MTEKKERLKKLYALALRGVGGEKEQAQAILDKLLKKYAMTLDDLDDEVIQDPSAGQQRNHRAVNRADGSGRTEQHSGRKRNHRTGPLDNRSGYDTA